MRIKLGTRPQTQQMCVCVCVCVSAHRATSPSRYGSSPRSMMPNMSLYGMSASLGIEGQNLAMTSARPNFGSEAHDFFIMYQPHNCANPTFVKKA